MSTILLIDDNPYILKALTLQLEHSGGSDTVLTASNGRDGISLLDAVPVDLLLTDLRMPFGDGYAVIEHRNRRHPQVFLMVGTGAGTAMMQERLRALGVDQYLEKPYDYETVASAIAAGLGRSSEPAAAVEKARLHPSLRGPERMIPELF